MGNRNFKGSRHLAGEVEMEANIWPEWRGEMEARLGVSQLEMRNGEIGRASCRERVFLVV